jgi:hypothetical protein
MKKSNNIQATSMDMHVMRVFFGNGQTVWPTSFCARFRQNEPNFLVPWTERDRRCWVRSVSERIHVPDGVSTSIATTEGRAASGFATPSSRATTRRAPKILKVRTAAADDAVKPALNVSSSNP